MILCPGQCASRRFDVSAGFVGIVRPDQAGKLRGHGGVFGAGHARRWEQPIGRASALVLALPVPDLILIIAASQWHAAVLLLCVAVAEQRPVGLIEKIGDAIAALGK